MREENLRIIPGEGKVYVNYEAGICPYCGSEYVADGCWDFNIPGYKFHCENCGKEGSEIYEFSFNQVNIKNGEEN